MILERLSDEEWDPTKKRKKRYKKNRSEICVNGTEEQDLEVVIPKGVKTVKVNLTFRME